MKNFIVGGLMIGLVVLVGFLLMNRPVFPYGASAGPTHLNLEYFYAGGIIQGGIVNKTGGTSTSITAADVCDSSVITYAGGYAADASSTLPTAASLTSRCFQYNGDGKKIIFWNKGAAASTTGIIAGTGITLFLPASANKVIDGGNMAILTFMRASSSAVYVTISEGVAQ